MVRISQYQLLLILCLVFTVVFVSSSKLQCTEIEQCLMCKPEEIVSEYCKETGRRVKISCKDQDSVIEDYKSCLLSAEDEQLRLIIFQVVMTIVGGLAYWGVQTRKASSLSLFDTRRRYRRIDISYLCII